MTEKIDPRAMAAYLELVRLDTINSETLAVLADLQAGRITPDEAKRRIRALTKFLPTKEDRS